MKAEVSISIDIIFICEAVGSCHIFYFNIHSCIMVGYLTEKLLFMCV